MTFDPAILDAMARAAYGLNPCFDQPTDLDGRPTGPAGAVPFDDLAECDGGLHDLAFSQASEALAAALAAARLPDGLIARYFGPRR